jgi:hypothetical protein
MKMKKVYYICFLLLVILVVSWLFFNNPDKLGKVIVSKKNAPLDMPFLDEQQEKMPRKKSLVYKVSEEGQLNETWDFFGFKKSVPDGDFENKNYFFVSVRESGTCPFKFKNATINDYAKEIVFYLQEKNGNCTSDATPRTFVMEIDKSVSSGLENAAIVYLSGTATNEVRTVQKIAEK